MFALAVAVGPGSSEHSVAHGTASPGATAPASPSVTAPATAGTVPAQDSASAKLAAETTAAANPVANALGSAQQPSWRAKPRVMRYLGYQFQVPSSWPVYNLATDPSKCVLFSTHAVYLGTPGSGQNCPASAVGRTEALLIQPDSSASTSASAIVVGGGRATLSEDAPLPAATTATSHMFQVEIPKAGVLVTATYGTNEAGLRSILAGAAITGQTAASGTGSHVSGSAPLPNIRHRLPNIRHRSLHPAPAPMCPAPAPMLRHRLAPIRLAPAHPAPPRWAGQQRRQRLLLGASR